MSSQEKSLPEKVLVHLQSHPEEKFTAKELAAWVFKTYPDECRKKQERSRATVTRLDSDDALIQQLSAEINASTVGKLPNIKMTDDRPRQFYFSTMSDEEEVKRAEKPSTSPVKGQDYTEHDLYPVLGDFLKRELQVISKRINEKRSHNAHGAGGNHWLFPDLVGFEDLGSSWQADIKGCAEKMGDCRVRLWSFEVKKLLNRSNVREAYFQAVSNSSWANLGYLVAAEIHNSEEELRLLAGLHGIGVIRIDPRDPAKNVMMIPARERPTVDWNVANRLAEENKDFLEYIQAIRDFHLTGKIHENEWY